MQPAVAVAAIVGLSLILSVSIYAFGRVRTERERTVQKLIDHGLSADELLEVAALGSGAVRDLRRGLLLVAAGVSWSTVTFLLGGSAWMFGVVPMALGSVYVLFWVLHGRSG